MEFVKGDFLIVKSDSGRNILVRGVNSSGKNSTGYTEQSIIEGKPETLKFSAKNNIIANLGPTPKPGNAYGCKIEPWVKNIITKGYGDIQQFLPLDAPFEARLLKRLFKMKTTLKEFGVSGLQFKLELREPKGKYAGWYKSGKGDHVMALMPQQGWESEEIDYVIAHEYGHAWWYQRMGEKRRLRWIRKYYELVQVQEAFDKELKQMLEDLQSAGDVKSFQKDLDEETKETFKSVLQYLKRVHKITPLHLNLLVLNQDDFSSIWPATTQIGKPKAHLTEYATVSPEELFAEAFAFHVTGKKIPKDLVVLMEKSLK
jgi:hypothetical protein